MSNNHPRGNSSPEPYHTAASKPSGYNMTCRGVARQGEDGRPLLVRQVRQVRQISCKRHAAATRIPPLPSSCQALPQQQLCARVKPNSGRQTHGVYRSPSINSKKSPCFFRVDKRCPLGCFILCFRYGKQPQKRGDKMKKFSIRCPPERGASGKVKNFFIFCCIMPEESIYYI